MPEPTSHEISPLNAALSGRYVIEREIGRGGMATVYLARDARHDRMVAIKVLRPDLAARLGGERFLREIRIAATLQHPNILTLIDSGDANGVLHYVMPFVEGESLRQRLGAGRLPTADAVRYLRDLFDALSYAHAHGVVHRDIKPDNIIISGRHALVVDFGVAKAMSAAKESQRETATETLTQIGTSIGTPAYMSPEQAAGDPDVDHRADIYAAGIVAYEMLAGHPPFTGAPSHVLKAQISATPEPLAPLAPRAPASLVSLVMRCIEKDPAARFQTADEALAALDEHLVAGAPPAGLSRRTVGAIAAAVLIVVVAGAFMATSKFRGERWVRTVAIPEIQRFVEGNNFDSAYVLATRAERFVGRDSVLQSLAPRFSGKVIFPGLPAGAHIFRTAYNDSLGWTELRATADSIVVPLGVSRYRIEAPGHHTLHVAGGPAFIRAGRWLPTPIDSSDRMVRVSGGRTEVVMPGLSRLDRLDLPDFYIDKHEVTNAEYKRFVEAGGYEKPEYWEHPVMNGTRVLSRAEAQKRFVDRTGRHGPSTWEGGDFPAGQGDMPVSGISWYEAAAYAKFAGKSLPTLYHWNRAASAPIAPLLIPGSNYGGQGPARGGTFHGMGPFGTFDMAGNVREWVWNAVGGKRYNLGGGWSDGSWSFSDAYAQPPIDRNAINGMRLVRAASSQGLGPEETRLAVKQEIRDYTRERPASDATYEAYKSFFVYDKTPFNEKLVYRDTTAELWVRERVSFDAAYGGERMAAVLLIPKGRQPPFQTLLVMGGSNLLYTRTDSAFNTRFVDFVVKSGRMVVLPVYKGMFDRNIGLTTDSPMETSAYRDLMVAMVKDTRRTIDFLGTRPEADTSKIAYLGLSFGGRVSPPILAAEPRIKAVILNVAGLKMEHTRPEVDPINFLPRITAPVLMLNGRYDYYFPMETSQKPFFEYLGTPREHKKWVVYPEAHTVPRTEYMRESLAWLDKYLGPTK